MRGTCFHAGIVAVLLVASAAVGEEPEPLPPPREAEPAPVASKWVPATPADEPGTAPLPLPCPEGACESRPHLLLRLPAIPEPEKNDAPAPGPIVQLRGRIHADAVFVTQSLRDKLLIGDLENAVGFRRARLGAQGTIGDQVRWVSEFDFAGGVVAFKDVYVALDNLPVLRQVRIGHFREPYSLEAATSSNDITFLERSPGNALDPGRNWGVGVYTYTDDERATLQFGGFASGTNSFGDDTGDGNDLAMTARATALPWYDADGRVLAHVGAAFSQRYPKGDVVTFSQSPQSNLLEENTDNPLTPFVRNIAIAANQYQLYNAETAAVFGPLSLQAEINAATVDQLGGGPVFLYGWYAQASWFLTGEHRGYDRREGRFAAVRVLSPFACDLTKSGRGFGPGAWEVTARFGYLDFGNANLPLLPDGLRQGSRVSTTTVGLNWYLNDHARLMFNYVWAVPVDPNFGPSYAHAVFFRTQVAW